MVTGPAVGTALPPRRRWTLQSRLTALVLAVAALALVAVDVIVPINVRTAIIADRDRSLTSVVSSLPNNRVITSAWLAQFTGSSSLGGEIGWTVVTGSGLAKIIEPSSRDPSGNPAVGRNPPIGQPQTVGDSSGTQDTYRILAVGALDGQGQQGYLVAWSSLDDVNSTIRHLVVLELVITAGLLVLLGLLAGIVIRRQLRPLEAMATAADEIALGDVSRRVPPEDPSTEVGRLGTAFNGMLDGIGNLLDEQQRNEARLRQFVADASHELRTPVAAVRGYSELYRAGMLPDEAAVARAMERMGFEARRMGGLVEDLLTLIRADAERMHEHERVDLSQLLVGVVDDAAVIDPTRTWRLAGASAPAHVMGDRLRLHQLFANLLSNVRTHTPPGTTATVSVLSGQDEIAVTVTDDGPGVTAAAVRPLLPRGRVAIEGERWQRAGAVDRGRHRPVARRPHPGAHAPGGGLTTVVLPRPVGTGAVSGRGTDPLVGVTTGPIELPVGMAHAAAGIPAAAAVAGPASAPPAAASPAVVSPAVAQTAVAPPAVASTVAAGWGCRSWPPSSGRTAAASWLPMRRVVA